jgi:hypothetical protein
MALGYKYWIVYLPAFSRESFLLFVHNPAESTKLRDYSNGEANVLGQPSRQMVFTGTEIGRTRFEVAPHLTTDGHYWQREIQSHNSRYLPTDHRVLSSVTLKNPVQSGLTARNVTRGRARRGSQRQLQDYVNEHEAMLTSAVLEVLPPRLRELDAHLEWVSPLAQNDYVEYRDADFIHAVGLGDCADELASFWPSGGPSWDALAIISDSEGKIRPGVILLEAKSHIREIYGSGCQASPHSREKIETALANAKHWCGAEMNADWTGPLYQSANRLAHLYFIRERLKRQAWLVNVYFTNDPIGPAEQHVWQVELQKVRASLGLPSRVTFIADVFLPALTSDEDCEPLELRDDEAVADVSSRVPGECVDEIHAPVSLSQSSPVLVPEEGNTFGVWASRWMVLARYDGPSVPDVSYRIEELVRQWREPIPGSWQRGTDPQLMGLRYRRGDIDAPHEGEHRIEHDILCRSFDSVTCFGNKLIDGVNALPLVRDSGGARTANVEADMYLLTHCDGAHRLFLCEVKADCNDAWYAAVESLRQMRLLMSSPESLCVFTRRNPSLSLSSDIPVTALVLAPPSFYSARGKEANAVGPAVKLIARFGSDLGVDVRLAVWDSELLRIKDWHSPG